MAVSSIVCKAGQGSDTGAEREHLVWDNLVFLLLIQDYLLDNQVKKTYCEKRRYLKTHNEIQSRRKRQSNENVKTVVNGEFRDVNQTGHKGVCLTQDVELTQRKILSGFTCQSVLS